MENQSENIPNLDQVTQEEVKIVKTDVNAKDGQNKCPKCGATEISLNANNGKLRCHYCRYEFEPEKLAGKEQDISKLQGQVVGSGATNIVADTNDVVTFKCSSCGAEVIVDTASSTQARCHWCRNTLSVNQQIPNGAVPDTVLPFKVTKNDAKTEIENFVGKRKFFANPTFRKEFTTENIMGVYLPYMIIDANTHANLKGEGEHETRHYTESHNDSSTTYYDAELYAVERDFDLTIEGLTIESSKDKLNTEQSDRINNIINAIMPFDTENCVKWDSNYIKGYTSEKRDTNVTDLKDMVEVKSKDIARFACNETIKYYDRGVKWQSETLEVKGQQWMSAYLPVWLYSYHEEKNGKSILHYVAVNARTKETMGSIPIHMPKLFFISFIVELLGFFAMYFTYDGEDNWPFLFLLSGIIYFIVIYSKYRNRSARHNYETETKTNMSNLKKTDRFIQNKTRLTNSRMSGANNKQVNGATKHITDISNLESLEDIVNINPFNK